MLDTLYLGNLDAKRDWGYAPEYVESMWLILQQDKPDDYVVATGETHTVREFCEHAFGELGMTLKWEGKDEKETGICTETGKKVVKVDEKYFRPTEVEILIGDPSKAKKLLGWEPKTKFEDLVKIMVRADYDCILKGEN